MAKKIRCPVWRCRSTDCLPVKQQTYKAGKGIALGITGAALAPVAAPVFAAAGVLSGFTGKKKVKFVCQKCGRVFEVKL